MPPYGFHKLQINLTKIKKCETEIGSMINQQTNSCMGHRDLLDYCYICWAITGLNMKVSFRQRGTGNQDLMF